MIKYFQNSALLSQALTHRSIGTDSNERLEFLGDAILSFLTSEFLFKKFSHHPEGILTNLRSNLVCTQTLSMVARRLNLGPQIKMFKGEADNGGRENSSILADTVEAIIGGIYLDSGLEEAKRFVAENIWPYLEEVLQKKSYKDAKSLLQEEIQKNGKNAPRYELISSIGPAHEKIFTVAVYDGKKLLGRGSGRSKKEAEESAAQEALENLK